MIALGILDIVKQLALVGGLSIISIILVVIVGISSKNGILSLIKSSVSGLFVFYMLTFSFVYVSLSALNFHDTLVSFKGLFE